MRNIGISLLAAAALALPAAAKTARSADAQVTCKDGTTSKAGRGACSHHGGIGDAHAQTPAKSKTRAANDDQTKANPETSGKSGGILGGLFGKREAKAQGRSSTTTPRSSSRDAKSGTPTARCKDGTTSYSAHHSGTCSGHGGVAEWLGR